MARTFADALQDALCALNEANVDYALSGGVAMALYGAPRFTKDVDVLVLAEPERMATTLRGSRRFPRPFRVRRRDLPRADGDRT